jgi:hypothetical protein
MKTQKDSEININIQKRDGYLYAFFTGNRNELSDTIKYWKTAIEECNKYGYKNLLIEQDLPNPLSITEIYSLIGAIVKMPGNHPKTAFIDRDLEQKDMDSFGLTVASNRGLIAQIFTNISDAEKWLLS